MPPPGYQARRATLEDIEALRAIWASMGYDTEALARRVTEFQVVETSEGVVVGALGLQILKKQGWIHSEGFTDFSLADRLRPMLWDRMNSLASNHGVVRLWTDEQAPFWRQSGLAAPDAEATERLPAEWREVRGWTTLKLREDVDEILSSDQEIAIYMQQEKQRTQQIMAKARVVKTVATIIAFLLLAAVILAGIYLLRRSPALRLGG